MGLPTGATGTGKTVTLQTIAEGFCRAGVPVFAADIKGDLSGVSMPGEGQDWILKRCEEIGLEYVPDEFPVIFWDLFGEQGHPVRATVSEMGPLLLARLMNLNEIQEGVLNVVFRVADEQGLLLLDLKDLRAMLAFIAENAASLTTTYGNVAPATVGAIQRALLVLENQGADKFFGEPALKISDLMRIDPRNGYGTINILAADKLMAKPAALCLVPVVAAVRTVRGAARGRRPRQAEAGVLLRRGAPAVRRGAEGLLAEGGAGGAPDPLQGRRRLFRDAEPARRAGQRAGAAGQPRAARAARLHPARPEGGEGRRRYLPPQSQAQYRAGHHRARQGRGAGLDAGGQRHAVHRRAHADRPALRTGRPGDAGIAGGGDRQQSGQGHLRHHDRPRIRL